VPLLHLGVGGPDWLDWTVHLDTIAFCVVLLWAYAYVVRDLRPRVSDAGRVKRSQVTLFCLGVFSLFLAGGTPIHDLGEEYLLSVHMFQHLLFTMIAAPLLLAGIPAWFYEWLLRDDRVLTVARVLTKPVLAFSLFNVLLVLTHLPPVVDLALQVGAVHFAIHVLLLASAMLMWWPVLSPIETLPKLSYPGQIAYLFLQSLLPSVIASFVTFADTPVYDFYEQAPRIIDISPISDQQIAGGLMKLLGSIILWTFIGVAFFKWYEREQAEDQDPKWSAVERELDELGLNRR
jgi:putative membrane protein